MFIFWNRCKSKSFSWYLNKVSSVSYEILGGGGEFAQKYVRKSNQFGQHSRLPFYHISILVINICNMAH